MIKSDKNSLHVSLTFFCQKKRTNNDQKVVEPILELGNIGQSWEMSVVAHFVQFWNPDPLFTMVTLNNDLTLQIEEP